MVARERFARIWIAALVLMTMAYGVALMGATQFRIEMTLLTRFAFLGAALGGLGVIALVALFIVRDRSGDGIDERDRRVEARASVVGYYILMAGILVVGGFMPFSADKWEIVHAAIGFVVLAEIVHSALVLRGYERGVE